MRKLVWLLGLVGLVALSCGKSPNSVEQPENPRLGKVADAVRLASPAYLPDSATRASLRKRSAATAPVMTDKDEAVVDDDGVECPDADFTTIQDAIDSGVRKVRVCAGTYPENVVIGPDAKVNLQGDGQGVTVITGVAGSNGPIIDVLPGSKVNINDLTVDGGSAMATGVDYGILYVEASGKIKNVEVANIRNASGSAQGIGIAVRSYTGAKAKVTVEKCTVSNYTRVGVYGNGQGVRITVKKNTITGPVLPRVWAPNGIQISRGARAALKGNDVDNNPSPNPPGGAGSGILLFCAGRTNVQNNTVMNSDLGIAIADNNGATVRGNEVLDSGFDGISLQFIGLFYGVPLGCDPAISPTENNVVKNNSIDNSADSGISLANYDLASAPDTPNDNVVRQNEIDNSSGDGIHVWDGKDNDFLGNKTTGSGNIDAVDNTVGGGTAGTANLWKNNDCTTSDPAGLCK